MDRVEINTLIDKLIYIKDSYSLTFDDIDVINEACNLIEHNIDKLIEKE